jgi:hypothetical protein
VSQRTLAGPQGIELRRHGGGAAAGGQHEGAPQIDT